MASGSFVVASSNKYIVATLSWSATSNVTGNYSDVYCELRASRTNSGYTTYGTGSGNITINGSPVTFSISSSQKITQNSNTLLGSGTVRVYHNDNGAKTITISAYASISGAGLTLGTNSGSATLDTIPRKSSLTVSDGILGVAQTLTVTRQSTSFTHTITYTCGDYTGTICDKSAETSISFTPSLYFANGAPYGTSVYVSFTITTYNGDVSVGYNTYAIWCTIPSSVKPSVSFSVSDYNNYYGTYGAYVQNKSRFNISVSASGAYGSSITSYNVSANGATYTSSNIVTSVLTSSGTLTITVTVTDSRGRTASASTSVTVLPYNSPKITSFSVKRSDANGNSTSSGEYLTVVFSSAMSSLNNQNGSNYALQYKKTKDGSDAYTYVGLSQYTNNLNVSNGTYTFLADTSSSYNVQLFIADRFEQINMTQIGSATSKLFSILSKGLGFALGKVAELENTFEVDFVSRFYKKVTIGSNENIQFFDDSDGGNIKMISNLGTAWVMHTGNDMFRLYNTAFGKLLTYTNNGVLNAPNDVTTSSGHSLNSKLNSYQWTSQITVGSWSRICYVPYGHDITGSTGIISITFTRGNVVGNATFSFNVSHSRDCRLTLLGSNHYTGFRIRGVVDDHGNAYIEILDEQYGESGTIQSINCSFIPIIAGKPTLYTSATSGTNVPTNYAASQELLVNTKQPYTKFEINLTLDANAYVPPFSYYKAVDISSYNSYGYLINASANDAAGAPVPVSMDTDNATVRIVANTANVVLKLTYMRALST